MTRLGKIARLPNHVREQLNTRLFDGEQARRVLKWLNGLPEVKAVLDADFGGRPLSDQNISEWKLGGFEDWRSEREAMAWAESLREASQGLQEVSGGAPLVEHLTAPLAVMLGKMLQKASKLNDESEEWDRVLNVAEQITKLYRGSQVAGQLRLQRERWETDQEEKKEKQRKMAEYMEEYEAIMTKQSLLEAIQRGGDPEDDEEGLG